jgi:hypothetical protein
MLRYHWHNLTWAKCCKLCELKIYKCIHISQTLPASSCCPTVVLCLVSVWPQNLSKPHNLHSTSLCPTMYCSCHRKHFPMTKIYFKLKSHAEVVLTSSFWQEMCLVISVHFGTLHNSATLWQTTHGNNRLQKQGTKFLMCLGETTLCTVRYGRGLLYLD